MAGPVLHGRHCSGTDSALVDEEAGGTVRHDQREASASRRNMNAKPDRIPLGRFGDPEEVAQVAVMLASNAFITGQTINVNGGLYMSS